MYNYNSFKEFIIANCIFVKSRNKATSIKFVRNTCLPRGWQPPPLDSRRIRWPRYALGTMIRGTKRASLHDRTAKMQRREALYTHTHTKSPLRFMHYEKGSTSLRQHPRSTPGVSITSFLPTFVSTPLCVSLRPVSRLFSFPVDRKKERRERFDDW